MGILISLTLSIIISLATYRQAFNSGLNLNLLMALQLPVQTLRAWDSKSLVCYRGTTEHLTWKDLCYLITLSTKLNPHTAHKTYRELCWHKVTGGQWVRGEFSSYNESRKTWWRYNQIWIDVQLDTQDQKGMAQQYVKPQAAICTYWDEWVSITCRGHAQKEYVIYTEINLSGNMPTHSHRNTTSAVSCVSTLVFFTLC